MAYLSLIRIPGDADELVDTHYKGMAEVMTRVGPENGQIAHAAAKTDDGPLIVNLWPSKDASEAAAQHPETQRAIQASGVPREQVQFEHHEVFNHQLYGD